MKPNSSVFQPCCVLALTRLSYCTLQCIWSIKLILSLPFLIHMLQVFVIRQLSVEMILFPCYSSALFCHMLCLIVADWSIEEQHFCSFCVCYFWWKRSCRSTLHVLACTCVFSQSSRSINNLLAHDQNASPVLPPLQRAIVWESRCLWMCFKRATWKSSAQLLENFLCWRALFVQDREKIGQSEATHALRWHSPSPRGLWGLRSPIREWWLSPWDETHREPPEIQSRVPKQDTKSML